MLIRCIDEDNVDNKYKPSRVRYAALRLVSDTRKELAAITDDSMPQGVNANLLDSLCRTLFAAVCPNHQTNYNNESDTPFHEERNGRYISLVFCLAKNGRSRQRLISDGHFRRCIDLVDKANQRKSWIPKPHPSETCLPGLDHREHQYYIQEYHSHLYREDVAQTIDQ